MTPDERPHRRGGKLAGAVVGVALTAVFEPHGEHQRKPGGGARTGQRPHARSQRRDPEEGGIAAHRRRPRTPRRRQYGLPAGQLGVHRGHRPEARLARGGLEQPALPSVGSRQNSPGRWVTQA